MALLGETWLVSKDRKHQSTHCQIKISKLCKQNQSKNHHFTISLKYLPWKWKCLRRIISKIAFFYYHDAELVRQNDDYELYQAGKKKILKEEKWKKNLENCIINSMYSISMKTSVKNHYVIRVWSNCYLIIVWKSSR